MKKIITFLTAATIVLIPFFSFAGNVEITYDDAKISMEIPSDDIKLSVDSIELSDDHFFSIADIDIPGEEINRISISYTDETTPDILYSSEYVSFKGVDGKKIRRFQGENDILYCIEMDNGLICIVDMQKVLKGGYESPLTEEAVSVSDDIIKSFIDSGIYLKCEDISSVKRNTKMGLIILLGTLILVIYSLADKYMGRERKPVKKYVSEPVYTSALAGINELMKEKKTEGILFLNVSGYYGRLSSLREFNDSEEFLKYIETDFIKTGKTQDGSICVNYDIDLLKTVLKSVHTEKRELYIRATERETTFAFRYEGEKINIDGIHIEYDEENMICYIIIPVNSYFSVSEKMREELDIASRGGHHHPFS